MQINVNQVLNVCVNWAVLIFDIVLLHVLIDKVNTSRVFVIAQSMVMVMTALIINDLNIGKMMLNFLNGITFYLVIVIAFMPPKLEEFKMDHFLVYQAIFFLKAFIYFMLTLFIDRDN